MAGMPTYADAEKILQRITRPWERRVHPDDAQKESPSYQRRQLHKVTWRIECDPYSAAIDGLPALAAAEIVSPELVVADTKASGNGTPQSHPLILTGTWKVDEPDFDWSQPGKCVITVTVFKVDTEWVTE